MSNKSIGVFVCECGGKIPAGQISNVSYSEQANYWCLPANIERMRAAIAEQHLDRVVIAGCSPRTHEALFHRALDGVVDLSLVNIVNVRDLCFGDPTRAREQIAMAVADISARTPQQPRLARIMPHAIVIGGGIAGTTAALAISDADIPVTLVERETQLSGASERIGKVCAREKIRVMTNTTITQVSGTVGQYRVALNNGETIQAGAIIVASGASNDNRDLAEMLRLPIDTNGFVADTRVRLRPVGLY